MNRQILATSALALVLCLTSHVAAFGSALLESAKQDFQAKRFHAAADSLNKVVQNEPANPEGYYWLGRALEELKDRDGAKTMYMSAFKLNPFGPQAPVAKKALLDLSARQAQLDHPTDGPEVTAQTLQLIEHQAADWKRMKVSEGNMNANWKLRSGDIESWKLGYRTRQQLAPIPLPVGPTAPIQSVNDIRNLARMNAGAGNPYLNPYASGNGGAAQMPAINPYMTGNGAAINPYLSGNGATINPYTNAGNPYANRTYDNWAGYPGNQANQGNTYYQPNAGIAGYAPGMGTAFGAPGYIQLPAPQGYGRREISNQRQIQSSYIRHDSMVQAMKAQQQGVQSAAELQKSANNLESLLGEKPRAGSPHLRALGTNLFVRNYSEHDDDTTPPVDPVQELKATQMKLSDMDKGSHAKALKLTP